MLKKISTVIICLTYLTTHSFDSIAEQLASGSISAETKTVVEKINAKLGLKEISIKYSCDALAKHNESFLYCTYFLGSLFINEDWLNSIPAQEKQFALATQLARVSSDNKMSALEMVIDTSLAVGCFYALEKYKLLPSVIRRRPWTHYVLTFGIGFTFGHYVTPILYKPLRLYIKKQTDKKVIRALNCRDAAINFLHRLKNHVGTNIARASELDQRIQSINSI